VNTENKVWHWTRIRPGWYESAPAVGPGVFAIYKVEDDGAPYWNVCLYHSRSDSTYLDLVSTGLIGRTLADTKWELAIAVKRGYASVTN
jgi:hypothetical protein